MAFQTSSGASLGVCLTAPSTFDATGYGALTFKTVGEITNIGEFGKEWTLVTHEPLASRGTKKAKGMYNNGTLSPTLALDRSDAGQIDMVTARDQDEPAYFVVTLQGGELFYYEALVMKFGVGPGAGNDVVGVPCTLELTDREIVEV